MIYVIGEVNGDGSMSEFVKVGFVGGDESRFMSAIKERVNKLQVGNPRRLVVIGKATGDRAREKQIHYLFAQARVRRPQATEWLRLEEGSALAEWVESVRIDTLMFGAKAGVGSRGGTPYVKGRNRCGQCKSAEHMRGACPDLAAIREARRKAKLERAAAWERFKGPKRSGRPPGSFVWRGVERHSIR